MDLAGDEVGHHSNVSNASSCLEYCQNDKNCSSWTFHDRMCYMKNKKVIRMKAHKRISGTKDCNENGKQNKMNQMVLGIFIFHFNSSSIFYIIERVYLECRTKGGKVSNELCVFPFIYKDVKFSTCTDTNHDAQWCATKTDEEGKFINDTFENVLLKSLVLQLNMTYHQC